jgi:O-methyltransferase
MNETILFIQYFLITILVVYALYYVYGMITERKTAPVLWKDAVKKGKVSRRLQKALARYGDKERFFNLWFQTQRLKRENIRGDFAELGVYKGDTAEILHLLDGERKLHLFDTFEGFCEKDLKVEEGEAASYTRHNFADTSLEKVKKRLNGSKFVFHKGYFPETAKAVEDVEFALVSMDADLYNPTKAGLEFFYPRLVPGGVIIVHDYNPKWSGIMKAVNEFAAAIPETAVPLTDKDSSVMIIKCKDKVKQ